MMSTNTWLLNAREWIRGSRNPRDRRPRIGLALGGGFARGISHVGTLRVFENHGIPIDFIAGVSAGSMVAAAYASGSTPDEIEAIAQTMRFRDVARWTINRLGLADSERMIPFLNRLLKTHRLEDMKIPLAVVASDLNSGQPTVFRGKGDAVLAIRASCSYPGLFTPIRHEGRLLVDGMVAMEVPALPLREMGATHVISVSLPNPEEVDPQNMFSVVNRSFQILTTRTEREWRRHSTLVLTPKVANVAWDCFGSCGQLVDAGERAALEALPTILKWLKIRPEKDQNVAAPVSATA